MASRTESSGYDALLWWLVRYRLVIYLGGLIAIATPRLLRAVSDVELGPTVRTAIVVVALAAMILTYVGERRVSAGAPRGNATRPRRSDARSSGSGTPERGAETGTEPDGEPTGSSAGTLQYSRRTRVIFAAGLVGVVFGTYVALEVSVPAGLLFVFGAILFAQSAYRRERDGTEDPK